jgi:hypothetical protein
LATYHSGGRSCPRASVCGGCSGAALVPTPQLTEAGLSAQARLRRYCCVERRHVATPAGARPGKVSGFGWAPTPRKRGSRQNRRGNFERCLRQVALGRRELFARPQLDPTELAGVACLPAAPGSVRPACLHRCGFDVSCCSKAAAQLATASARSRSWRRSLGARRRLIALLHDRRALPGRQQCIRAARAHGSTAC